MQKVTTVDVMRCSDAETIKNQLITGRELMCRAGEGIFQSYPWSGEKVAIVCGSGNNAGDGYVLALFLQKRDIPCSVILLSDRFSSDGRFYFDLCLEHEIEILKYESNFDFSPYTEIVDCIFGTGFSGEVNGVWADAIRAINAAKKTVISVDINSGLNGDTGKSDLCVHSDLTVSIGYYQYGHFLGQARDVMKRRKNIDIGIDLYGDSAAFIEVRDIAPILKKRSQASHKGTYGYVAIVGGCREYSGAVKLANLSCAALRSGCGVATLAVPNSIVDSVSPYLLESTLAPIPDENGHMVFDLESLDHLFERQDAIAIGMGWGKGEHNAAILSHLLSKYELPVVIDADGLNTLAQMDRTILQNTKCKVLLTPHYKEFSRLSGYSIEEIENDPVGLSKKYAAENKVCLLLKGSCTIVTDGEEVLLVNRGCAGMATAGSGDVLSGVLVGLLGYSPMTPLTAACGAYIAGLAGEFAQNEMGEIGMIASDTVQKIPKSIMNIKKWCI